MSLVALALRVCAVRALESAAIFAADRIYDSAFLPVDEIAGAKVTPFAIISTEQMVGAPTGRDLMNGSVEMEFIIEIGLTRAIKVSVPDGEDHIEIGIAETDGGLEASLALVERQVVTCLFGRGGGEWGEAFRTLCSQIRKTTSRRAVSAKEGTRFAARQIVYEIQPIAEPPIAREIEASSPFLKFLTLAEADQDLQPIARAVRDSIEGRPVGWPDAFTAAAVLGGYTEEEAQALGIGLLEPDSNPPAIDAISVDSNGQSMTISEAEAQAQLPEEPD